MNNNNNNNNNGNNNYVPSCIRGDDSFNIEEWLSSYSFWRQINYRHKCCQHEQQQLKQKMDYHLNQDRLGGIYDVTSKEGIHDKLLMKIEYFMKNIFNLLSVFNYLIKLSGFSL